MRTKTFFIVAGLIAFCSWTTQRISEIKKAGWLIGTWKNETPKGSIYESWIKVNDNEFSGKSYAVKEKDTIVFEAIRLVQEQDNLFYIPTVRDQNNGLPVRFAMKKISDNQLIFENPQHDFPQLISYTKINADSLVAEISGTENGKKHKQAFPMKRMK